MRQAPRLPRWETLDVGEATDYGVFAVRQVVRRSTRTGKPGRYQVLEMPSWVNVVALTPGDRVVLVEQYRHGLDAVTWEIPGGAVDDGEDPAAAAERELREETGYTGAAPLLLGTVHPNPAIQGNACTTWLIADARPTSPLEPDDGEHIEVVEVRRADIPDLLRQGRITHSLVIAAFHWLELWRAAPDGR
jgi:8-oxo-dGTP pyrophosphatase MutT (NUDIX family)